ncbi:YceI family protein [bacterium]|nr:YceI family protein [bacterium]
MPFLKYFIYLFLWPAMAVAQVQEFTIDASSSVFSFQVEHFGVATVNGSFSSASGTIQFDAQHPDSMRASLFIDVESISTNNKLRDKELKSEDFLDVNRYPRVSFASSGVVLAAKNVGPSAQGNQRRRVQGQMTMYGQTRDMEIPFLIRHSPNTNLLVIEA